MTRLLLSSPRRFATGIFVASLLAPFAAANVAVAIDGENSFVLNGDHVSYRFHVDETTGDLITDHFGGFVEEAVPAQIPEVNGWVGLPGRIRREFPDQGRGDFRVPAVHIRNPTGSSVTDFQFQSYDVIQGKPANVPGGLPGTFGSGEEVSTLVVHMYDNYSSIAAHLSYSVFPQHDAIVRSVNITNEGTGNITIEKLASFSVDLPYEDLDMIELRGDWAREAQRVRRKVEYGTQGFGSTTGYSSHLHNPFLALVTSGTTESQGEAWGMSLVYSGSFQVDVEKGSQGFTRAMMGFNPLQLSWPLAPGETLQTPECVSAYSSEGVGGLSRIYHNLYRNNLMRSKFATQTRPVLLNSWEGLYFDYNESTVYNLAQEAAQLGVKLFVLDDGWFGEGTNARLNDTAGLGDWTVNTDRFPDGLAPLVSRVKELQAAQTSNTSTSPAQDLQFGLWFEPEMVNPNSTLYQEHPDWVLYAGDYPRTTRRNQLVLNVGMPEVQDFIINSMSKVLDDANGGITYIKWDNNRGMHELASPSEAHQYMLGLYNVFDTLTTKYPDILWEGCASGGGRFDPGVLQYFPQVWTSDDTDGLQRIYIQFGTSLAYPPSAMGAHVSAVPNGQTGRTTPLVFRAHVAMMGGSFGLELDPAKLEEDEKVQIPELIALAEAVNPLVVQGNLYRLALPEDTDWPAAMFISQDGSQAVLFAFQMRSSPNYKFPQIRLQGLNATARYTVNGTDTYAGSTLMNIGLQFPFEDDFDSRVILIDRV